MSIKLPKAKISKERTELKRMTLDFKRALLIIVFSSSCLNDFLSIRMASSICCFTKATSISFNELKFRVHFAVAKVSSKMNHLVKPIATPFGIISQGIVAGHM
jgi:hypothetical protein